MFIIKKLIMLLCFASVFSCVGCGSLNEKENKVYKPLEVPTIETLQSERVYWVNPNPNWQEDKIGHTHIEFVKEYKGGLFEVPVSNFKASRSDDDITFKVAFDVGNKRKNRLEYYWHRIGSTDILMPQNGEGYNALIRERKIKNEVEIKPRGYDPGFCIGRDFGGMIFEKTVRHKMNDEFHIEYYPKYDFALGFFRGILYSMTIGDNSNLEVRYVHYLPNSNDKVIRYIVPDADDNILKANLGDPVIREQHRFYAFRGQKGPECVETTQINGRKYLSVWAVPGSKYFKGYHEAIDKLAKSSNKKLVNKAVSKKQKTILKNPLGLDFSKNINEQSVKFKYSGEYRLRGAKNSTKVYHCIEFDKLNLDSVLPPKKPVSYSEFQEIDTLNKVIITYEGKNNDVDDYLMKCYGKPVDIKKDQYMTKKVWTSGDFEVVHSYSHAYYEGDNPTKITGEVIITKVKK